MLSTCLPLEAGDLSIEQPCWEKNKVTITSLDPNTRLYDRPLHLVYDPQEKKRALMGLIIGTGSPLAQVVKFEGRYYLKNGYHRAYYLRMNGIIQLPCILLEANSEADIGLSAGTLPMNILKSNNPPTMGHFTNNRAFTLPIKRFKRRIQISWAEAVEV